MTVAPTTPYTADLDGQDPLQAMRDTRARVETMTASWTDVDFARSYGPGKWTARQILIHLAQTELALGTRARMALATPNYAAQSFDQDAWMAQESGLSGRDAANAYLAISRMNAALYAALSDDARQTCLTHPEYGALTVDWIIHQMAGHQIHHLKQLDQIHQGH